MLKKIEDILAECIEDVKAGRCSVEDCLGKYPSVSKELEPLLRLALEIREPPDVKPSTAFKVRARVQLMEQIHAMRGVTKWRWFRYSGQMKPIPYKGRFNMVAIIIAIVLAVSALGGGTVYASQDSLPGEILYPVKIATEQVRLVLTPSEAGKAKFHITLAERRIEEIAEMSKRGETEHVVKLMLMVAQHLEEARQVIVATGEGKVAQELKTKLKESAIQQLAVLEGALQQATKDTKPVIAQALETSGESYGIAIEAAIISAPAPPLVGKVGTIQIFVTDPPLPDVAHVWVEVENIEVHLAAGPDSRWIPVADKAERFDLMALEGVQVFIASEEIPAGFYTQLRMNITKATIEEIVGGELVVHDDVFVPSGRLKFVRPFQVEDGEITGLVLDFDGERSLNVTEAGQYMLKPVVMLLVPENGGDGGDTTRPVITLTDTTPPSITLTDIVEGQVIVSPDTVIPEFTVSDDDPDATATATLNGKPFPSGTEVYEVGKYELVVTAIDTSGNEAEVAVNFEIVAE